MHCREPVYNISLAWGMLVKALILWSCDPFQMWHSRLDSSVMLLDTHITMQRSKQSLVTNRDALECTDANTKSFSKFGSYCKQRLHTQTCSKDIVMFFSGQLYALQTLKLGILRAQHHPERQVGGPTGLLKGSNSSAVALHLPFQVWKTEKGISPLPHYQWGNSMQLLSRRNT